MHYPPHLILYAPMVAITSNNFCSNL